MKISLFIPCYVDQLTPEIGFAVVNVLERLGHQVEVPSGQTCCGQPAMNNGYEDETRMVARHILKVFADSEAVVIPSGSCGATIKHFYPELFAGRPEEAQAKALAAKTWEFSEFLVDVLKLEDVGARFPHKVTWHDGCHGLRELHIQKQPRTLLAHVRDLELVEMKEAKSCCGFGGTFAIKFPQISTAMTQVKTGSAEETGAEYILSNDPSCMLQIQGYLEKQGSSLQCLHLAQVLEKTSGN
ncbi:MAG: (Fe-S)-binding protein [Kiritimatiellae bacterium]|jgi:L-lactate dehydrogenase complex protein LldE|nr:(Fe-S)-binding protein [Kiritimatiellia bacterium]